MKNLQKFKNNRGFPVIFCCVAYLNYEETTDCSYLQYPSTQRVIQFWAKNPILLKNLLCCQMPKQHKASESETFGTILHILPIIKKQTNLTLSNFIPAFHMPFVMKCYPTFTRRVILELFINSNSCIIYQGKRNVIILDAWHVDGALWYVECLGPKQPYRISSQCWAWA